MKRQITPALLGGVLFCFALASSAQAPPVPAIQVIPSEEQARYHFDYTKTFFASDAAYHAALTKLDAQVAQLQEMKGKVATSPKNLYQVLTLSDDFNVLFSRVYWYLTLKYSTNTKDVTDRDKGTDLDAKLSPKLTFINDEIQKMPPAQISKFLAAEPRLRLYQYVLTEAQRSKPHTLSLAEEELLAKTQPLMTQWQSDEYDLLMDRAPWGKVHDPDAGDLDVRQDEGRIDNSPTRVVRQEGSQKENAAYAAQRDLFAFDVLKVARTQNQLAQIRHFRNGQDAAFFNLHLGYRDINTAYAQIQQNGALNKRFQTLRRSRIASFTGYDTVHYWDMSVVPPGVEKPRFTIDQATQTIEASTAYLGPEWNRELRALLNPANGRLDIVPGSNRVPNAFAIPSPGTNSVFYSYGYEGYLTDVTTLAHESGHVVHNALQNNAHVPASLADGPRFFTESYAILDEFVVIDSLYRKETDPGRKVYYLEQLLQELMSFYGNERIASIEKSLYEGADKGTLKNADDLDALTYEIGSQTSIWYDIDPEVKNLWEEVPHYYSSPTYYVNYVFADLLAETYFSMYKKDPVGFAKKFTALERNGFNDTPQNLLKKFFGISLSDPKTYAAVFQQQQSYLSDLEKLYAQVPVTPPQSAGESRRVSIGTGLESIPRGDKPK